VTSRSPPSPTQEWGSVLATAVPAAPPRTHARDTPAASILAYSPPLGRLGVHAVADDGVLHHESVSAGHELRADARPERTVAPGGSHRLLWHRPKYPKLADYPD